MTKMAAPIANSWKLFTRHKHYLLSRLKNVNPGLYPWLASTESSEWGLLSLLNQSGVLEDTESGQLSLFRLLHSGAQTVYCGFDPTANSLHIGNLLPVIALMHFRNAGHNVVAVIGGATAQIGDPCGKPVERNRVSVGTVKENARGVRNSLQRLFIHFLKRASEAWIGGSAKQRQLIPRMECRIFPVRGGETLPNGGAVKQTRHSVSTEECCGPESD